MSSLPDVASSTIEDLQLSPHRVELGDKLSLERVPIGIRGNGIEVDLVDQMVEEVADLSQVSFRRKNRTKRGPYRPRMPSSTTNFEPREMSSERGCEEHRVGILLEFLEGDRVIHGDL